jgi:hypothetical protein
METRLRNTPMLLILVRRPAARKMAHARDIQKNAVIQWSFAGMTVNKLSLTPGSSLAIVGKLTQASVPNQVNQSGNRRIRLAITRHP